MTLGPIVPFFMASVTQDNSVVPTHSLHTGVDAVNGPPYLLEWFITNINEHNETGHPHVWLTVIHDDQNHCVACVFEDGFVRVEVHNGEAESSTEVAYPLAYNVTHHLCFDVTSDHVHLEDMDTNTTILTFAPTTVSIPTEGRTAVVYAGGGSAVRWDKVTGTIGTTTTTSES